MTLLDRSTKGSLLSIEHGKVIAVAEVPNWQGTEAEKHDLLNAFARNCDCLIVDGVYTTTCAGHALIKFQKGLDDLLFGRRIKQRLIDEEWSVDLSD